jgi:hypothetical protein
VGGACLDGTTAFEDTAKLALRVSCNSVLNYKINLAGITFVLERSSGNALGCVELDPLNLLPNLNLGVEVIS